MCSDFTRHPLKLASLPAQIVQHKQSVCLHFSGCKSAKTQIPTRDGSYVADIGTGVEKDTLEYF